VNEGALPYSSKLSSFTSKGSRVSKYTIGNRPLINQPIKPVCKAVGMMRVETKVFQMVLNTYTDKAV